MAGIHPDQGPPLPVPFSFFLTAPISVAAAGGLLLATGGSDGGSVYSGFTLTLVHLCTLGFLMLVMLGALYQVLPVVAGAQIPSPRLGYAVQGLLVLATTLLTIGLGRADHRQFLYAFVLALVGLLLFVLPAGWALVRTRAVGATPWGIRLALLGLIAVAAMGLRLAWGRGTFGYTEGWFPWRHAHAHLGLVCWVGMLIASVSWQVVPMFFLAAPTAAWSQWATIAGVGTSLLALASVYFFGLPVEAIPWCAAPGAVAVWLLHPVATLGSIRKRKRKRKDPTLWFWLFAMAVAPVVLAFSALSAWLELPYVTSLYGLLALWGWAGMLVHGMLARIVPFLVWLHRCSKLVGLRPVPSARELYPDRYVSLGFVLHVSSLVAGAAAICLDTAWSWRLFGALLLSTAGVLFSQSAGALRRAPRFQA